MGGICTIDAPIILTAYIIVRNNKGVELPKFIKAIVPTIITANPPMTKNLLVEEYPLAEQYITEKGDNKYIFEREVGSLAGLVRFVLGLIDEVTTHLPESLREHLREKLRFKP